ncbi:MAG: phosphoribosyltransferase family protein, partial [Nitrospinota bacterium]
EGINLIGKIIFETVSEQKPDAVGGLTLGADPLAVAVAGESHRRGQPLKAFVIRKQPKEHGTMLPVEGDVKKGESVIILEDVTTTGESALKAVKAARDFGLNVLGVVTLADRQEGGREAIEKENVVFRAIFTKEQIFERYRSSGGSRAFA